MKLEVKLFARARDLACADCVEVVVPDGGRVGDVRTALAAQVPELSSLVKNLLIAVDANYADDSTLLAPQADVACFPPVSGG